MEISPAVALFALSAQGQTQMIMSTTMLKAQHASEMAMIEMMQEATNMVKARQAPPPAGMGGSVDRMA